MRGREIKFTTEITDKDLFHQLKKKMTQIEISLENYFYRQNPDNFFDCGVFATFYLFQINDSLFPIGAYSHSYGLETYIQKKLGKDIDTAFEYLKCNLKSNSLYSELLAINLSYEYANEERLDKLIRLDNILNASKSPKEIRLASQKLGSRFIKTLISTNINYKNDNFTNYVNESKYNLPTHTFAY